MESKEKKVKSGAKHKRAADYAENKEDKVHIEKILQLRWLKFNM